MRRKDLPRVRLGRKPEARSARTTGLPKIAAKRDFWEKEGRSVSAHGGVAPPCGASDSPDAGTKRSQRRVGRILRQYERSLTFRRFVVCGERTCPASASAANPKRARRAFLFWFVAGFYRKRARRAGLASARIIGGTADALVQTLQGVEHFFALQRLIVPYNAIVSLDLTQNAELTYVNCSFNRLTELNVSGLAKLGSLNCENNYLTALDLSGVTSLFWLYCRSNKLEALDVSDNTALEFIETFDNNLSEFDPTGLTELKFLHIDHNKLTFLDMSRNKKLEGGGFVVRNNYMERLVLTDIENFAIDWEDIEEQNPKTGYDRYAWYADAECTVPVQGDPEANGQTLYCKYIPNDYTIYFSANGGTGARFGACTVRRGQMCGGKRAVFCGKY